MKKFILIITKVGLFLCLLFVISGLLIFSLTTLKNKYSERLSAQLDNIIYPKSIQITPYEVGFAIESYFTRGNSTGNYCVHTANDAFYSDDSIDKVMDFYKDKTIIAKDGAKIPIRVFKIDLPEVKSIPMYDWDKCDLGCPPPKYTDVPYIYLISVQDFSDVGQNIPSYLFCM